jgi:biopolymer transport protein ExbD
MKIKFLLVLVIFFNILVYSNEPVTLSAANIKIDKNAVFLENKKISKTSDVAEQDSLLIEAFVNALKDKPKSTAQIQVDPSISYNIFYKITATLGFSGYNEIRFTSKINEKNYTESVDLPKKFEKTNLQNRNKCEKCLDLAVILTDSYIEIWARGGALPKIFFNDYKFKETTDLWVLRKEKEKDPGIIEMSVYSKSDSAYLDENNNFITSLASVVTGSVVATLAKNSQRRLVCGLSGPGVEDICVDGKSVVTLRPRSAYDELAKLLIMIHNRFIDSPDSDNITILANDNTEISKIILLMHRARTAGFTEINLAKRAAK